jgi:hypothetical protein
VTVTPPHPTDYRRTLQAVQDAAELYDRIALAIPIRWHHILDALPGQPGAQSYDADLGGPGSVVVCNQHGQDIDTCHRNHLVGCVGTPIPKRTDPTGQAGTAYDPTSRDLRDLRRLARAAAKGAEDMVRILERYGPRPANAYERQVTRENDPGCASCARLPGIDGEPRWEPIEQGVRINGEIVKVCSWCRTYIKAHGYEALPPRDAVEHHHRKGDRRQKRSA